LAFRLANCPQDALRNIALVVVFPLIATGYVTGDIQHCCFGDFLVCPRRRFDHARLKTLRHAPAKMNESRKMLKTSVRGGVARRNRSITIVSSSPPPGTPLGGFIGLNDRRIIVTDAGAIEPW
jgi:hypothetical protein